MLVKDLDKWLSRGAFEPFVMRLTTDENIAVEHPDAAVPGTSAVLVIKKRKGRLAAFWHISLFHVVRIEPLDASPNGRSGNGHKGRRRSS